METGRESIVCDAFSRPDSIICVVRWIAVSDDCFLNFGSLFFILFSLHRSFVVFTASAASMTCAYRPVTVRMSSSGGVPPTPTPTTPIKSIRPKRRAATDRLSSLDRIAIHNAELDDDLIDDDNPSTRSRQRKKQSKSPNASRHRKRANTKSPKDRKEVTHTTTTQQPVATGSVLISV